MAIASGIKKITSFKKQSGLGVPASGTGGKEFRRTSTVFKAERDMYESNEIQSHHMSTGAAYGLQKSEGTGDFELSPGTYADLFAALIERNFAAITPGAAAAATTVAFVSGFTYTITRGAGSFLTDGIKAGHVIRISGSGINAANVNKNLWVVSVTALVCTVYVINETPMVPEGPIATYVLTVVGKETFTPLAAHTEDYFTVEEWYSNISKSETFTDQKVGSVSIDMPSTGVNTGSFGLVGLGRTVGTSQVLTSPTATNTGITAAINGLIMINGAVQPAVTSFALSVDKSAENAGAVVGSNVGADVNTGRIRVSGTITAQFDSTTLRDLIISETVVPLDIVVAVDQTATSDFISFTVPAVKLTTDTPDDGEKTIVRTYTFTAEFFGSGGASMARRNTIVQMQDSAA